MSNTQLTNAQTYNVENMIFSEAVPGSIPNSVPKIEFKRINISTKNPDGTVGELILSTERLFSFGVSPDKDDQTQVIKGYKLPLCMWSRDGATPAEKKWTDTFTAIVERCKDHLIDEREEIDKFDLVRSDLRKLGNALYRKHEKYTDPKTGKTSMRPVPGTGPTLYAKLLFSKKKNSISTAFFNSVTGHEVDPAEFVGKYMYAKCAVKIESIFIGQRISLQVKIYEAEIEEMQMGRKRLLNPHPTISNRILTAPTSSTSTQLMEAAENEAAAQDDPQDSLDEESEEEDPPPKPKKVAKRKKTVRKVFKKK
jgi:hypothetical protein